MLAVVLPLTLLALAGVGIMVIVKERSFEEPVQAPPAQQKPTVEIRPAEIKKAEPTPAPEPQTPTEIIAVAVSAFQTGNFERANNLLSRVDLEKAGAPLGWELAGLLSENAKDDKEAYRIYSRGISSMPTASLYYRRALLNRDNGDQELAMKDFDEAIRRAPTDIVISNERLLFLIRIGRGKQAREELETSSRTPGRAEASNWIFAQCALAMEDGNYKQAAVLLTEAKQAVDPRIFEMILKNTVISSHMAQPEVMPFYIRNIGPK